MKEKHTRGNWVVMDASGVRGVPQWTVCDSRGCRVAKCDPLPGQDAAEELANALLIAAAPELLTALEEILAANPELAEVCDSARAAIAKAKGNQ
jgi:hypothetical protein